jgi:rare lipoprotein A
MTCAHRSLPFGTRLLVTNLRNNRTAVLTVADRGPFIRGRIVDVSMGAANALGFRQAGVVPVKIETVYN